MGAVTVQLAKASGAAVISTASSHNLSTLKSQLGADYAFDYKSETIVTDILGAVADLKNTGHEFVGVYGAISLPDSFKIIAQIFDKLGSSKIVTVKKPATVLPPSDLPGDVEAKPVFAPVLDKDVEDSVLALA